MKAIDKLGSTFLGAIDWPLVGAVTGAVIAATALLHATNAATPVVAIVLGGGASVLAAATLLGPMRKAARLQPSGHREQSSGTTSPTDARAEEVREAVDASASRTETAVEDLSTASNYTASLSSTVRRVREGDLTAWEEIIDRSSGLVWAITRAHKLTQVEAADVVQTTWLRLVESIDRIQDPERLGAWLATVARRECLRAIRLRPGADRLFEKLPDESRNLLLGSEGDPALQRAFASISPRCQALLLMSTSSDVTGNEEIAAALEMPVGAIRPMRARCLDQLRRAIEREKGSMSTRGRDAPTS